MKIGIVGAGLIGKKRAASLNDSDKLYYVCDINKPQAKSLAKQYSALYTCNVQDLIKNDEIETVIISVQNGIDSPYELHDVYKASQIVPSVFRGICLVSEPGIISVPSQCSWTLGEFQKNPINKISSILSPFIDSKLKLNVSIDDFNKRERRSRLANCKKTYLMDMQRL